MADKTGGMELDPKYDDYDYPIVAPNPQSGHPGNISEQQQAQVSQLRLMLEAQGCTKRLDTLTLVCHLPAARTLLLLLTVDAAGASSGFCVPASSMSPWR